MRTKIYQPRNTELGVTICCVNRGQQADIKDDIAHLINEIYATPTKGRLWYGAAQRVFTKSSGCMSESVE